MIVIILIAAVVVIGSVVLAMARTVLLVSYQDRRLDVSITILGCGIRYDTTRDRLGLVCGRFVRYFAPSKRKREKKAEKEKKVEKRERRKKRRRRLPIRIVLRIATGLFVFAAEILARFRYDGGQIRVVPMIADPAVAGMTYGWGRALYGAVPGLRGTIDIVPTYGRGRSSASGHLALSIRNGSIIGPLWRLLRKMPITGIIRNRFSGRSG